MNWLAWAPTIITLVTAIFMAGRFSSKMKEHDEKISDLDADVEAIKVRFGGVDIALTKLEAWRDGYNAGSHRRDGFDPANRQQNGDR